MGENIKFGNNEFGIPVFCLLFGPEENLFDLERKERRVIAGPGPALRGRDHGFFLEIEESLAGNFS